LQEKKNLNIFSRPLKIILRSLKETLLKEIGFVIFQIFLFSDFFFVFVFAIEKKKGKKPDGSLIGILHNFSPDLSKNSKNKLASGEFL